MLPVAYSQFREWMTEGGAKHVMGINKVSAEIKRELGVESDVDRIGGKPVRFYPGIRWYDPLWDSVPGGPSKHVYLALLNLKRVLPADIVRVEPTKGVIIVVATGKVIDWPTWCKIMEEQRLLHSSRAKNCVTGCVTTV